MHVELAREGSLPIRWLVVPLCGYGSNNHGMVLACKKPQSTNEASARHRLHAVVSTAANPMVWYGMAWYGMVA